jgi:hypothetical protein
VDDGAGGQRQRSPHALVVLCHAGDGVGFQPSRIAARLPGPA